MSHHIVLDSPALASDDPCHQSFRKGSANTSRERILRNLEVEGRNTTKYQRLCTSCGHSLLRSEKENWCCGGGTKTHYPWRSQSAEMRKLMDTPGFGNLSRIINSLFALGVLHAPEKGEGLTLHKGGGAPMLRVNGQLHATISRRAQNCWFIVDSHFDKYFSSLTKKELTLAAQFRSILRRDNVHFSVSSGSSLPCSSGELPSLASVKTGTLHVCTNDEDVLSIVFVGPTGRPPARTLAVVGSGQVISEMDNLWEVLMYPLYHPTGDAKFTWRRGMQPTVARLAPRMRGAPSNPRKDSRQTGLSLLQYLRSVMMFQPEFWKTPRLAQQFILDTWSRNETHNMEYWKSDACQRQIKQFIVLTRGPASVNPDRILLPSKVPGSYAYQRTFFHDALHLTTVHGNPHLFITMTANPHWPEIVALANANHAYGAAKPADRLDCVARAFVHRLKKLKRLLKTRNALFDGHEGAEWMLGATEWQQGGLPHCHMAVRLRINGDKIPMLTVQDQLRFMDSLLCAHLPDPSAPHYDFVNAFMTHGSPCTHCVVDRRDGTRGCRFYFPKQASPTAGVDRKGYSIYRRTETDTLIVPHIPLLLLEMQCHVNVEYTLFSGCIAYLYKYFVKGGSSSAMRLDKKKSDIATGGVDEIAAFRKARILCAAEATYRAMGYKVNFREPSVIVCRIHLPRQSHVGYSMSAGNPAMEPENNDIVTALGDTGALSSSSESDDENSARHDDPDEHVFVRNTVTGENETHLDMYFCRPEARECQELKFTQFFSTFSLHSNGRKLPRGTERFEDIRGRIWVRRTRHILARIPFVSLFHKELYALRLLLLASPATSYVELRGTHPTFRDKALYDGLIDSDIQSVFAMLDAVMSNVSPYECRRLFCLIMTSLITNDVSRVWGNDVIRKHISHDFLPSATAGHRDWPMDVTLDLCLMDIALHLNAMGHSDVSLSNYGLPEAVTCANRMREIMIMLPSAEYPVFAKYATLIGFRCDVCRREVDYMTEVRKLRMHPPLPPEELNNVRISLNEEQTNAFHVIRPFIDKRLGGLYHIDASAGCGKTYWANFVREYCRSTDQLVLCVATTGIAALHFVDGRTGHSMFRIPVEMLHDVIDGCMLDSSILLQVLGGKNSNRIQLLRTVYMIVWDELSMLNNHVFQAVDRLLCAVMDTKLPFGGKLLITLGDWKQLSPVDPNSEARMLDPELITSSNSSFHLSVLSLPLWKQFTTIHFTINERQKYDTPLHEFVTRVGEGIQSSIPITDLPPNVRTTLSVDEALTFLFESPGHVPFSATHVHMCSFLCPFNADVDKINAECEQRMRVLHPDVSFVTLKSADSYHQADSSVEIPVTCAPVSGHAQDETELNNLELQYARENDLIQGVPPHEKLNDDYLTFDMTTGLTNERLDAETFAVEHLNGMHPPGCPSHLLTLCPGMLVMMLRNLDPSRSLLNGKRFVIDSVHPNGRVLFATASENYGKPEAKVIVIPRILFKGRISRRHEAFLHRRQFPLRPCYAITIHKSQASTLRRVVVDLRQGVFDHGQLYVALSRVREGSDLMILIRPDQTHLRNIVIDILLGLKEK